MPVPICAECVHWYSVRAGRGDVEMNWFCLYSILYVCTHRRRVGGLFASSLAGSHEWNIIFHFELQFAFSKRGIFSRCAIYSSFIAFVCRCAQCDEKLRFSIVVCCHCRPCFLLFDQNEMASFCGWRE